jgi:hypothetical protein
MGVQPELGLPSPKVRGQGPRRALPSQEEEEEVLSTYLSRPKGRRESPPRRSALAAEPPRSAPYMGKLRAPSGNPGRPRKPSGGVLR